METFKRNKPETPKTTGKNPEPISFPIDKVVDYLFNSTRDKMREVTIIDRLQGRLLPLLDVMNLTWDYVLEVALYRQDSENYKRLFAEEGKDKPIPPNLIDEYIYRVAQWQKSVGGENFDKAIELAQAELETRGTMEDIPYEDPWKQ